MSIQTEVHPCVIIGAGPAGISAALWLRTFEVPYIWIGGPVAMGGTLNRVHNRIDNFPPRTYDSGKELASELVTYSESLNLGLPDPRSIRRIEGGAERCQLVLDDGDILYARTVILATGTSYRVLGVPGETEGLGKYVSQSATADGHRYAGQPVAVVGGGDAGFENALRLAELDCEVSLLVRSPVYAARQHFVDAVEAHEAITILPVPTIVTALNPTPQGCRLELDTQGARQHLDVACLFVRIGVTAHLPDIEPALDTRGGYLVVDAGQTTSHPLILAAGDVTDTVLRSVATTMGDGAKAAQSAAKINDLVGKAS